VHGDLAGRGFGRRKVRNIIARTTVTDSRRGLARIYYLCASMPGVVQATAQEISILSAVDLVDLDCTVPDVLRSLYAFGMGRKTEN
jgi:hypothetical protein